MVQMPRNAYRDGKKQVNVLMSLLLHRQLVTLAASRGTTMQDIILDSLRREVERGAAGDRHVPPLDAVASPFVDEPLFGSAPLEDAP